MSQKIGPREQQLRDMRDAKMKRPAAAEIGAALPKTSGKKPVRKSKKKR